MSIIFKRLKAHALELEKVLSSRAFLLPQETPLHWTSNSYNCCWFRRANIDVIDASATKRLWMMHLCVFPQVYDGAPIYGFDIVAGENKITGAFLDFSPVDIAESKMRLHKVWTKSPSRFFIGSTIPVLPSTKTTILPRTLRRLVCLLLQIFSKRYNRIQSFYKKWMCSSCAMTTNP